MKLRQSHRSISSSEKITALHNEAAIKATKPYVELGGTTAMGLYPNIKDGVVQVFVAAYRANYRRYLR